MESIDIPTQITRIFGIVSRSVLNIVTSTLSFSTALRLPKASLNK